MKRALTHSHHPKMPHGLTSNFGFAGGIGLFGCSGESYGKVYGLGFRDGDWGRRFSGGKPIAQEKGNMTWKLE